MLAISAKTEILGLTRGTEIRLADVLISAFAHGMKLVLDDCGFGMKMVLG